MTWTATYYFPCLGTLPFSAASFNQGTGPVVLNAVQCVGTEARLTYCASGGVTSQCTHAKDAGVRCHTQTGMYVRIYQCHM